MPDELNQFNAGTDTTSGSARFNHSRGEKVQKSGLPNARLTGLAGPGAPQHPGPASARGQETH